MDTSEGLRCQKNKTFTMSEASHDGINNVTAENWAACVRHVVDKVEPDFSEKDCICENVVEEFTICVGTDSSSDEDDDDD